MDTIPGVSQPGPDPGAPPRRKVRPGPIWYVLALAVLAAGIASLTYGITSLVGTIDGLQRVSLPGHGTISLTRSGGYTVYYEGPGAQNGNLPHFHVNVAPASPGAAVASLTPYESTVHYAIGGHQGRAVLSLRVTRPGSFAVTTVGTASANADVAFGGSIGGGIAKTLLPAIPLIILGFTGGLLVLVLRIIGKRQPPATRRR